MATLTSAIDPASDTFRTNAAVYDGLAAAGWLAPWSVSDGVATDLNDLAMRLLDG